MLKKKVKKITVSGIIILITGTLMYELFWGKLFAFAPIIFDFKKYELTNVEIYIQHGVNNSNYMGMDSFVSSVENFHELKFLKKIKIFIFRDSMSFIHRSLSTKPRFITYYNRIFISPWALREHTEGKIDLKIYMQHEFSHTLIFQHASFIHAYRYPKWLLEGIAVYSSHQMGTTFYPSKKETYYTISQGNFLPPLDYRTKNELKYKLNINNKINFIYSEFACLVDYLIQTYGKEKLIIFMKELLYNNDNNKVFKHVYHIDFSQVVENFKTQAYQYEKRKSN